MPRLDLDRVFRLEFSQDKEFTEFFTVTNIVAGSMKVDEMLTDKDLKFGNLFASKMEVQIYDKSELANLFMRCICTEDGVDKPVFFGIVDSCTRDYSDTYRDLICYDMAYYYSKKNAGPVWNLFWLDRQLQGEDYCILRQLRSAMFNAFGIKAEYPVTLDQEFVVHYSVPIDSISVTEMISMLYATSALYWHFDREGWLRPIFLSIYSDEDSPPSLEGEYEKENSIFEEAPIAYYTDVQIYDVLGNLLYDTDTSQTEDEDKQPYVIKDNLIVQNMPQSDVEALGNALLTELDRLRYTPGKVEMIVGDLDITIGDKYSTKMGDFFAFHNTLYGPMLVNQTLESEANLRNDEVNIKTSFATEVLKNSGGGGSGGSGFIDIMSNIVISAGIIAVGAFQATLGINTYVDNRNIRVPDVLYNTAYVEEVTGVSDPESQVLRLKTSFSQDGESTSVDSGYLAVVEFDDTDFQENIIMKVYDEG